MIPKYIQRNENNDLLFRNSGKTEEQIKKEQEEKMKVMKESTPNMEEKVEYFTE